MVSDVLVLSVSPLSLFPPSRPISLLIPVFSPTLSLSSITPSLSLPLLSLFPACSFLVGTSSDHYRMDSMKWFCFIPVGTRINTCSFSCGLLMLAPLGLFELSRVTFQHTLRYGLALITEGLSGACLVPSQQT